MKIEIDLPEIEGYEYTGEYRFPKEGEKFVSGGLGGKARAYCDMSEKRLILKKKAPVYPYVIVCGEKFVGMEALRDAIKMIDSDTIFASELKALRGLVE
jgi:hypothetical protein